MTKGQNKKRALMASIISLILCVSMLLGSTMAWFTDTVSNTGNRIVTGELGVQLFKYDGTRYVDISVDDGKGDIFTTEGPEGERLNGILWEPGKTEVVLLQVANTEDLALNYNMILDVRNDADDVDLTDALSYAIIPNVAGIDVWDEDVEVYSGITSWEGILNVAAESGTVPAGITTAAENGALLADESDYFALAVHMDENAGNAYQGQEIVIDVTIEARQMAYEYDSFGNQYDANAGDIDFAEEFDVYQVHEAYPIAGNSGFAIVAEFDGAPGQIGLARTTQEPEDPSEFNMGTPWDPMAIARVEDPDGNLVALYDFSDLTSGREAVIIDIPEGKAGIWTIRMMNGQVGDIFEIGINDTEIWGVRGEKVLGSGTLPESGSWYVYTQRTYEFAFLASDSAETYSLYDLNNNLISNSAESSRDSYRKYAIETSVLEPETVYELRLSENFNGTMVIDGIPGLLCPTAEAAAALKGAWVDEGGDEVYQGVLQQRAREELVRLATEENLTVTIDKPEEIPAIENPIAEAQLFGTYGLVSGLSGSIERQNIDPTSPFCGRVFAYSEMDKTAYQETGAVEPATPASFLQFQRGKYGKSSSSVPMRDSVVALAAAATLPLELNYFYENEALINRAALELLYIVATGMDECGLFRQSDLRTYVYLHNDSIFTYAPMVEAYAQIEPYLEGATREILSEAMLLLADKLGEYRGQGVTNQAAFGMTGRLLMYGVTGDERYHEAFKRQVEAILDSTWSNVGYNQTGYFVESGCDGSYGYMNQHLYYTMYIIYKEMENADQNLIEKMRDMIEGSLEFESLFALPQPEGSKSFSLGIAHFNSRATVALGRFSEPSFELVYDEFPMAARRMQLIPEGDSTGATYPQLINTEAWALQRIESSWAKYHTSTSTTASTSRYGSGWPLHTYAARHSDEYVDPCLLPCEEEDGYLRENGDGIVALKHKGLYVMSFYGVDIDYLGSSLASSSYMGGGPSAIWSEGTGTTTASRSHNKTGASLNSASDIRSSCIYGTDGSGTFFVSGKEDATLSWIEQGKSFVISGVEPNSGKTVSWQYDLTETGVDITASLSGTDVAGEYWLNLPIYIGDTSSNKSSVTVDGNKLVFTFGDSTVEYTWDNQEAVLQDVSTNYTCLRIKLTEDTVAAKVSLCLK